MEALPLMVTIKMMWPSCVLTLSGFVRSTKRFSFVMNIYDFMTLPTWENAKVVEEPHEFTNSILQSVQNYTTATAAEDTHIPLHTLEEVADGQPDSKLAKKAKAPVKWKASVSSVGPSEPDQSRRINRLRKKASKAGVTPDKGKNTRHE
nr:hypothetical protein [Tanacetum cinerariifolium]